MARKGSGQGTKTATNARVTHTAPTPTRKLTTATEPIAWAVAVLVEMNHLSGQKRKIPITVNNVETLLRPITGEGSMGQQGGFLRDNNPWNIGTGCSPTGAYGGTPKAPFGPDSRCGGGPVYLNTFSTVAEGVHATAQYLLDNGTYHALANDAPSGLVLSKTWYKGDAQAQSAVPVTAALIKDATGLLPTSGRSTGGPAGPVAPPDLKRITQEILNSAHTPHQGVWGFSPALRDQFAQLDPTQRRTVLNAVDAELAKERNLSLAAQIAAAAGGIGSGVSGVASAVANPLTAVGTFFSDLTQLSFWKRVGMGVLGVGLVIGGVVIFLQSTKTVQGIEGKVVP